MGFSLLNLTSAPGTERKSSLGQRSAVSEERKFQCSATDEGPNQWIAGNG